MPKRKAAATPSAEWQKIVSPQADTGALNAAREVEAFWIHGAIAASQISSALVRQRGSGRQTKSNTDFELMIVVGAVVYKASIKGGGNPKIRDPVDGRIWVTQPCVICASDDNEEMLLLCGTDDCSAAVPGCERSHHTYCVGLSEVPEDDWFCAQCEVKRKLPAMMALDNTRAVQESMHAVRKARLALI